MAATSDIVLTDAAAEQVRAVAAEFHESAEAIAEEALARGLELVRKRRLFRTGVVLPEIEEARAILRRAGTEPPQPGDELPAGYKRSA